MNMQTAALGLAAASVAMTPVYALVRDGGDGSASIWFMTSQTAAQALIDNDDDFNLNEGSPAVLNFPEGTDFSGIGLTTIAEVKEHLVDFCSMSQEDADALFADETEPTEVELVDDEQQVGGELDAGVDQTAEAEAEEQPEPPAAA